MAKTKLLIPQSISRLGLIIFCFLCLAFFAAPRAQAFMGVPTTNNGCINNQCPTTQQLSSGLQSNPIIKDIRTVVDLLSGAVAIVVVGAIMVGGIQYALAGDKAEAVAAAKKRITNALIALAAFIFTFAFLQWIIPGGIFS